MTVESDEALVVRSGRGDRAAFEELVRRTARLLFTHLYFKTHDAHRAEDLVQETLLAAWKAIGVLEDPRTFRAWLTTIANSVLIDSMRRETRKKRKGGKRASEEEISQAADGGMTPAQAMEMKDERGRAVKMLEELPEEYRLPLMLRYVGGADYAEIGRQLAISNGSLRGLLQRGMKILRERMTKDETRMSNE